MGLTGYRDKSHVLTFPHVNFYYQKVCAFQICFIFLQSISISRYRSPVACPHPLALSRTIVPVMRQPHSPVKSTGTTPRRRPKFTSTDTSSSRTSTNAIKKRKRDLRRLLEHAEKLPANIRISHERELATCDDELEAAKELANRSQMIKKYHMVRFFGESPRSTLRVQDSGSTTN